MRTLRRNVCCRVGTAHHIAVLKVEFALYADGSWLTVLHIAVGGVFQTRVIREAKDEFYFSDSHDEESKAYVLWHARLAWQKPDYSVALYGRNLTDRATEVRGFGGFGNDPRLEYATDRYVQYGEPRISIAVSGLSVVVRSAHPTS